MDTKKDSQGVLLLNFLKNNNLSILNGKPCVDNKGHFKRVETKDIGNLVIDYFISNIEILKYDLRLKYWPFTKISDRRPSELTSQSKSN